MVVPKLCVLDEAFLVHKVEELFLFHKVVLAAILLSSSGPSRGMRYAEAKFVWILLEKPLKDGGLASTTRTTDDDCAIALNGRGVRRCHLEEGVGESARGGLGVGWLS